MTIHAQGRPRKRRGNYFFKLRPHWTGLVWLAAAIAATTLYVVGTGAPAMIGVVEGDVQRLLAPETGRLASIEVALGEPVEAGQVVARMDHTLLDAERAVAQAKLAQALVEADAERRDAADFQRQTTDSGRDIQDDMLRTEQMIATVTIDDKADRARLAALKEELAHNRELAKNGLIPLIDANTSLPDIAALEAAIESRGNLMSELRGSLEKLREALGTYTTWVNASTNDTRSQNSLQVPSEAAAELFETQRNLLDMRAAALDLKSRRPGIVSEILFLPGDMVQKGETVARLVPTDSRFVLGMLPESHAREVKLGQRFLVRSRDGRFKDPTPARVVFVAPEIQTQPGRISPISGRPTRVRRVRLELLEPHHLLPDETVQLEPPSIWRTKLRRLLDRETG